MKRVAVAVVAAASLVGFTGCDWHPNARIDACRWLNSAPRVTGTWVPNSAFVRGGYCRTRVTNAHGTTWVIPSALSAECRDVLEARDNLNAYRPSLSSGEAHLFCSGHR